MVRIAVVSGKDEDCGISVCSCGIADIWIFVCFIMFELSYGGAGIVFENYI